MFYGLVALTWFDIVAAILPIVTVALFGLLNLHLSTTKTTSTAATTTTIREANDILLTTAASRVRNATDASAAPATAAKATTTSPSPTSPAAATNGHLQKQKSEQKCDDSSTLTRKSSASPTTSLPSTPLNSSPTSSARNSISSLSNGSISHLPSVDSFSDEYHEDEDTLSLENLFSCDQSEIYASKKISFIIDELIQTEVNYVNNLRKGINNYGRLHERKDLPDFLQGVERRRELLGNIDEILLLHEKQILPMMLRNQRDLKRLFDEFAVYFDKNNFYCYVIFMMNKKTSMQQRKENREWFQSFQTEINDKLGIDSFLVQPVQRLTRYPLLLQQFISEFYKSGISCKPVLTSVCKLETRMRRLLQVANQAEEIPAIDDITQISVYQQGQFRKSTEFDAYHYRSRKKSRVKIFIFDRCLICAEMRKRRLVYRQHYQWESLDLQLNTSKSVTVLLKSGSGTKEEIELSAPEAITVTQWMRLTQKIAEVARIEAAQRGKFSLPTDIILGVGFAVWFIWHYLY